MQSNTKKYTIIDPIPTFLEKKYLTPSPHWFFNQCATSID